MTGFRLGLVAIGRIHFDLDHGMQFAAQFRQQAERRGFALVSFPDAVTDLELARAAAEFLAGEALDGLVIFQTTFADSQMITLLTSALALPVFLWAPPDERTRARLRLGSFTGLNLAAYALKRQHRFYSFAYAAPDDDGAWQKLEVFARAGWAYCRLKLARLGVVGERPAGMDTCDLVESDLDSLGVQVEHFDLEKVFERALEPDENALSGLRQAIGQRLDGLEALEQQPLLRTLATSLALRELAAEHNLSALAVRCWPEFFTRLGCAACGALSLLSDACLPAACEADSNGAISHLVLQWLAGEPAFNTDIVEIDVQKDEIVLWHCGQAPLSLADPDSRPRGNVHSNRKLPLVMDFALKPGPVTLLRLSTAGGDGLKLVAGQGEMLRSAKSYDGTSGVFRFERPAQEFMERFLSKGMEHHIAMAYGSFIPELEVLAGMLGLPFIRL